MLLLVPLPSSKTKIPSLPVQERPALLRSSSTSTPSNILGGLDYDVVTSNSTTTKFHRRKEQHVLRRRTNRCRGRRRHEDHILLSKHPKTVGARVQSLFK